ncbi:MAG: Lrp/AsnC family transcriptional regulator [Candidatus Geothermarchaeales archaeon]
MSELDDKSREIILTLLRNGRASFTELAGRLGVSVPSAKSRFESLRKSGLLDVRGVVNLNQFNWKIAVAMLKTETPTYAMEHAKALRRCPKVIFTGATTGSYDIFAVFTGENLSVLRKTIENAVSGLEGVEKADFLYGDLPTYPEYIQLNLPDERTEKTPCEALCEGCLLYTTGKCRGCPATIGGPTHI